MAYNDKYGRIDTEYGDIAAGEPVFIVRAQDELAPQVIRDYIAMARYAHADDSDFVVSLKSLLHKIEDWQSRPYNHVKTPGVYR